MRGRVRIAFRPAHDGAAEIAEISTRIWPMPLLYVPTLTWCARSARVGDGDACIRCEQSRGGVRAPATVCVGDGQSSRDTWTRRGVCRRDNNSYRCENHDGCDIITTRRQCHNNSATTPAPQRLRHNDSATTTAPQRQRHNRRRLRIHLVRSAPPAVRVGDRTADRAVRRQRTLRHHHRARPPPGDGAVPKIGACARVLLLL